MPPESVAVPPFRDIMEAALKGEPAIPFRVPPGIKLVRVDPTSGLPVRTSERGGIWEAFKPGTEPSADQPVAGGVLDGGARLAPGIAVPVPATDSGGIY